MAFTTGATSKDCCITISNALVNIAGEVAPSEIKEDIAVIAALKSPQNERGLAPIQTQDRRGKTLTVEVPYTAPYCTASDASAKDICTYDPSASTDPMLYGLIDVDLVRSEGGKIAGADFRSLCETAPERLAWGLQNAAKQIIVDMAADLYVLMANACGNYPGSGNDSVSATATLNLLSDDGDINKAAFAVLRQQFKLMHTNTPPIVVAGNNMDLAGEVIRLANQDGGVDYNPTALINGVSLFTDYKIDTELQTEYTTTDSYAIGWIPGAFRLIEAYDNIGDWAITNQDNITKTTIEMMGLTFDYTLSYDPKCDEWIWILSKKFDLFYIPEAAYTTCYNFNHKLLFKVGCGAHACANNEL